MATDTQPKPGEQTEEQPEVEGEPQEPVEGEDEEKTPTGEETEPEEGDEPEDEEAKADKPGGEQGSDAEEGRRRARNGWKRKNEVVQRRLEQLERQNALLLEQLTTPRQTPPPAKPESEKTPEEKAAEYIDGLVAKRLAEADTQRQQAEAQRQQRAVVTEFQRRMAELRVAKSDFDDVVMSADMPISPALEQALLTSEHGPAIMYELAKSPAELERLSALPPLVAAREIGRLEAKFVSMAPPAKTTKPALRPPAPPTSVNGSASSTRSLDDLPLAEYKRAMRSGRR